MNALADSAARGHFNPRSPSGLRRKMLEDMPVVLLFQSTQPEWAATEEGADDFEDLPISIHAARVGCDFNRLWQDALAQPFQSTQPEWAATCCLDCAAKQRKKISIHAARVGCDRAQLRQPI